MPDVTYRASDGLPLVAHIVECTEASPQLRDIPLVLLHGGGPDHHMFMPLARELMDRHTVVLPDVRGYGRSVCRDPARHTWSQYVADVISLLDHLGARRAIIGGAGLGATITLRMAVANPDRVHAAVLISVEDIEDDQKKQAEIEFMDAFASRARSKGIEAAWAPILKDLAPIIGVLVRDAIPRSDRESIAAAAAIGRDRSFADIGDVAEVTVPTLIFRGMDERHPAALAEKLALGIPGAVLSPVALSADVQSAEDLARIFAPPIRHFLSALAADGLSSSD